ncbi:MAG: helix-turn-helix domain-containing protein [Lentisphaeria bacterium]|nr:helix-turn-helix domain-containing protein [Lentisphaeria bacterium]
MKITREELFEKLNEENVEFSEALKLMRKSIGMNQIDYAKLTGVSLRALRTVEQKKGNPTLETISKLMKPFGTGLVVKSIAKK